MDSQMTVGKKLTLIGALLIGLTIVLGIVTLVGLRSYDAVAHSLTDDALAGVTACGKLEAAFFELRGDMWRHVASDDPADKAKMADEIRRLKGEIAAAGKDIQSAIYSDEERAINQKIDPDVARYYEVWDKTAALSDAKKNEEAYQQFAAGTAIFTDLKSAIGAEAAYNNALGTKYTAQSLATGARLRWLSWLVLLLSVGAGSGVLFLFVRSLTRALRQRFGASGLFQPGASAGLLRTGCIARRDLRVQRTDYVHDAKERGEFLHRRNPDDGRRSARFRRQPDARGNDAIHAGDHRIER
jgi:hypothetical protein